MNRRSLLAAVAAGLTSPAGLASPSLAATQCGPQWCVSGVDYPRMVSAYRRQEMPMWCWAASIQMIFAFYGYDVDQRTIVTETYGEPANLPAMQTYQLTEQLSREWVDREGREFTVSIEGMYDFMNGVTSLSNQDIIDALDDDRPLLIGNTSHAMVLASVSYAPSYMGPQIGDFKVVDPYPGIGLRGPQSGAELYPRHAGGALMYVALPHVEEI